MTAEHHKEGSTWLPERIDAYRPAPERRGQDDRSSRRPDAPRRHREQGAGRGRPGGAKHVPVDARHGRDAVADRGKHRLVYDAQTRRFPLPGQLKRSEGQDPTGDPAVDEAYDYAGDTYNFYRQVLGRRSLDNHDMTLVSSVHYGLRIRQRLLERRADRSTATVTAVFFDPLQRRLMDVVCARADPRRDPVHSSNLEYFRTSPAPSTSSFADTMGARSWKQWKRKQTVERRPTG